MLEKGVISGRQLLLLIFTFVIASATLYLPALTTGYAGQDAWISAFIGGFVGIIVVFVVTALGLRYPQKNFTEYTELIIGKWPGKILILLYILFYLHLTAIVIREVTTTVHGTLLPKSPLEGITFIILLTIAYVVKKGLEVIARINVINLITIYIALFTVFLLLLKDMDIHLLTPVLSNGIIPVIKASAAPAGWFSEVVSIAFLIPFVNKPEEVRINAIISLLWTSLTLAIITTIPIMVFGAKLTSHLSFPILEAVRIINVSGYIQRVEIIFLIPWLIATFLKICFFYYISVLIISQWFKMRNIKTLVLPVGAILLTMSLAFFRNNIELGEFLSKVWGLYSLPFELAVPTFLLIIDSLRKKGSGRMC